MVRDDLIVEIARRNPRGENDLAVLRGLPAREFAAIFAAVARARAMPPDQWPALAERDIDLPPVNLVSGFLIAVLADLCSRWSLTPGLVATTTDVKRFVRARYEDKPELMEDCAFGRGWRAKYMLPVLTSVLEGRRGLRIADLRRDAPLAWDGDGPPPLPIVGGTLS